MEKNLNEQQERIQALIETKKFEALTAKEREFVLKHLSQEEYSLQHAILVESSELYDDHEPRPLILPQESKGIVIPMYQAVAGIAAAIILSFFLFRGGEIKGETNESTLLATTDTVYVDKVVHDTVVEYQTKYVDRVVVKTVEKSDGTATPVNSCGISISAPVLPSLNSMDLENRGTTAANDETLTLVDDFFEEN